MTFPLATYCTNCSESITDGTSQEQPSSCSHMFSFWFQITPWGCCGSCSACFFFLPRGSQKWDHPLLCGKALRFLFLSGAPLFVPHGTTVSEEILYNVSVAQGRPCPGSLLHALVSPGTHALLQMMSSVIQETLCQTDPSQAQRDFFLKMIKHPSELIWQNFWLQNKCRKIPRERPWDTCSGKRLSR